MKCKTKMPVATKKKVVAKVMDKMAKKPVMGGSAKKVVGRGK